MPDRPVYWSEGMFLRAHHFQAAERHLTGRIREAEDWLHPYDWGLRRLRIDPDALRNDRVVVAACQIRLGEGTTLSIPEEVALDPLDLKAAGAFRDTPRPTISLAVRRLRTGYGSVAPGERYDVESAEIADENTGRDDERIEFRRLRPVLLANARDSEGYESIPIARLRRSADSPDAPAEIDPDYIPPLLAVEGWTPLREEADRFREYLRSVVRNEAEYLVGRKIAFDSQIIGESERILKLMACHASSTPLDAALGAPALHPFRLYVELCRLVGGLGLFEPSRRPPEIPAYDHDALGTIFPRVFNELRRMLGQAPKTAAVKRYFTLDDHRVFQVKVDADWLLDPAGLFIGIETNDMTEAECDEVMRGKCDWKLASAAQVEQVFRNGERGLKLHSLARVPPALPSGVAYFEFERTQPFWQDVLRTNTLGLRFKMVQGQDGFTDRTEVGILSPVTNRPARLKYAVYALRSQPR